MTNSQKPLAERMRPQTLEAFIGQEHITGEQGILKKALESGTIPSMILWGPAGVGKTTLAQIIANQVKMPFRSLSAISSGVKEVRQVIDEAKRKTKTLLFIDEIHRFSKAQQDALLGAVEQGIITLIGATTENPSFEVISPLLSRCQVYTLYALSNKELLQLINRTIEKDDDLKHKNIALKESQALLNLSGGDARRILNLLELVVQSRYEEDKTLEIHNQDVQDAAQKYIALYDKDGEQHYDIISAFIKSIRGSDPNAAIYWLARMLEGGEDIKFIARRLMISASEDIGNANPTALVIATNCFHAINVVGMPEAEIILAQATNYLATSAKSNASYLSIKQARKMVKETGDLPVPLHLRNAPTKLMKDKGYGKGYQYAHDYEGHFIEQEFLPEELKGTKFYDPGNNAREKEIREKMRTLWKEKYHY